MKNKNMKISKNGIEAYIRRERTSHGTEKATLYSHPVNYFDEKEGDFLPILRASKENKNGFEKAVGPFLATFSKLRHGKRVSLKGKDKEISWEFISPSSKNGEKKKRAAFAHTEEKEGRERFLYQNAEDGVDLDYTVTETGIKEDIIIKEKHESYRFNFALSASGVQPSLAEDKKAITFIDENGEAVFTIPAPFMKDARDIRSDSVFYELVEENGKYTFTVVVDESFVNAPERIFPVTVDPCIVFSLNNEGSFANLPFAVFRRCADTIDSIAQGGNQYIAQEADYITVTSNYGYVEKTQISLKPLEPLVKERYVHRLELILTPVSATSSDTDEVCPINFYHLWLGDGRSYNYKVGEELALNINHSDEFLDTFEWFTLEPSAGASPYSVLFHTTGEYAPRVEIEYFLDEDHAPAFKELPVPKGMTADLALRTGEANVSFADGIVAHSPLNVALSHIPRKKCTAYGNGFGLSLDETLKEGGTYTNYIYTDPRGIKYAVKEYFYYMNGNNRIDVSKKDVITDTEGNLSYNGHEVTRELRSTSGWEVSVKLEDVKQAVLFEQRTEEEIQLDEQKEKYKAALCEYVTVNVVTGDIDSARIAAPSSLDYDKHEPECGEMFLPFSVAMNYKAALKNAGTNATERTEEQEYYFAQASETRNQAETYYRQFQTMLKSFLQISEQLKKLKRQNPVAYMKKDGVVKGFNAEGYLVAIFDSYENIIAIERDESHRITRVYDDKGNEALFTYENGILTELCDVYGNRVSYTYTDGFLTTVTFGGGARLVLEYHENGNIKTVTATGGSSDETKSTFDYDNLNRLTSATHASTKSLISHGSMTAGEAVISSLAIAYGLKETTVTDAENETVAVYRFDSRENLSEYYLVEKNLVAEAKKVVRDYESASKKETVYTALSSALYSKTLENFSFDNIVGIRKEEIYYNTFRQPSRKTVFVISGKTLQEEGVLCNEGIMYDASYIYDAKHRLVKEETEESRVAYWLGAQICVSRELLRTTVTEYTYDALDRIVRRESYLLGKELSEGKTVEETVYGENGRVKESYTYNSLDPASKLYTVTEQDESGRTVAEYDATGRYKTTLSYAPDGSLKSEHLPNGACIAYGASPDGRSTSVTASTEEGEENTNITHYTAGVVTKLESGGNTVEYTYDGKRRVTSVSLNGQPYASYAYEENCIDNIEGAYDKTTVTYANGESFEKRDFIDHGLKLIKYNGATVSSELYGTDKRLYNRNSEQYFYDQDGRITTIAGASITEEGYTYDREGRVLTYYVFPKNAMYASEYTYAYDSATGKLLSTSVENILSAPKLDKLGRNAGKTVNVGGTCVADEKISYLKFGDRATSLPATLTFKGTNETDTLSYIYDKMGNICEIRENGRIKARYAYDALGRLIREDNRDFAKTECFVYDNRGNILYKRAYPFSLENMDKVEALALADEKLYSYDGDRLMSYNGEAFTYDVLGNPTIYRNKTLTWDRARLLSTFDGISFTYDGLGRCTKMGENTIAYDHSGNIVEANGLRVLYDHTGVFAVKYNDSTYFCKKNAQNDVIALLDNTGAVVVEYKYDAWGKCKVLNPDGTENTTETFIGNVNPFRYRGYYFDTNTGLYYLKSRFYDPETGRFLNADSIDYLEPDTVNGLNLYAYCGNNPIMNVDPSGHILISAIIIGAIIGAAIGFGGTVLADYTDDGEVFNGSIDVGAYVANTTVGAIVGGITGGVATSTITVSLPTLHLAQTTAGTIQAVAEITSVAVNGAAVVAGAGVLGATLTFARIGKSGGYRIDHHYPNDHDPKHVHISGDDGVTRVDINGNPIQGDRPMTQGEKKAFWKLIDKIIQALKPWN